MFLFKTCYRNVQILPSPLNWGKTTPRSVIWMNATKRLPTCVDPLVFEVRLSESVSFFLPDYSFLLVMCLFGCFLQVLWRQTPPCIPCLSECQCTLVAFFLFFWLSDYLLSIFSNFSTFAIADIELFFLYLL